MLIVWDRHVHLDWYGAEVSYEGAAAAAIGKMSFCLYLPVLKKVIGFQLIFIHLYSALANNNHIKYVKERS